MLKTHLNRDYKKVYKVIWSCKCEEHLAVANRLITLFYMKHSDDVLLEKLEKHHKLKLKRIRSK
jgi:hypothetical protein|tara:strand:- start:1488 stop:1679 length:192 start_codon:yes stop_codon:yes gene_type:complete